MPFIFLLFAVAVNGQDAQVLFEEGLELHDAGEYEAALAKYEEALEQAPGNPTILYEMALTHQTMGNCAKSTEICKGLVKLKGYDDAKNAYVLIGNCQDAQGNPKAAVKTYKKGLKKSPDYYLLHFNQGIAYYNLEDYDKAKNAFGNSIRNNPNHASSHFYMTVVMDEVRNRIPTILAISRFLALEPRGERAEHLYPFLGKRFLMEMEPDDDGNYQIYLSGDLKDKEDNFVIMDFLLQAISIPKDPDEEEEDEEEDGLPDFTDMTYMEAFIAKYEFMIDQMEESMAGNKGFFWQYYGPYFISMKEAGHLETFCYIINLLNEDHEDEVEEWVDDNEGKIDAFLTWQQDFNDN